MKIINKKFRTITKNQEILLKNGDKIILESGDKIEIKTKVDMLKEQYKKSVKEGDTETAEKLMNKLEKLGINPQSI
jgi:protein-arginine kinase activator protein McsA